MNVGSRIRHAWPITLVIHVLIYAPALVFGWWIGTAPIPTHGLAVDPWAGGGALLSELVDQTQKHYGLVGAWAAVVLTIWTLAISPLLIQAWFVSLEEPATIRAAIMRAWSRYGRSAGITALAWTFAIVIACLLVGASYGLHQLLDGVLNDRDRDVVALTPLGLGIPILLYWATWHDVARATVAVEDVSSFFAMTRAYRQVQTRTILQYLLWWSAAALAVLLSGWSTDALYATPLAAFALSQLWMLGRTFARAAWLAAAIPVSESRVSHADGSTPPTR